MCSFIQAIANKHVSGRLLFEQNAEKYNVDDAAAANDNEYEVTDKQDEGTMYSIDWSSTHCWLRATLHARSFFRWCVVLSARLAAVTDLSCA